MWGSGVTCSENRVHGGFVEMPWDAVQDVPSPNTRKVVMNGGACVYASESGYEGRYQVGVCRSSEILWYAFLVTENMKGQKTSPICRYGGVCPGLRHDNFDTFKVCF